MTKGVESRSFMIIIKMLKISLFKLNNTDPGQTAFISSSDNPHYNCHQGNHCKNLNVRIKLSAFKSLLTKQYTLYIRQ